MIALVAIFITGYLLITFENKLGINKAATALTAGVLCWCGYLFISKDAHLVSEELMDHISDISGILFFLIGAMTIVELIDAHDGFQIIVKSIKTKNKRKLLWIISVLTFILSAVLDNLTTTILMVSLLRKLIPEKTDRWYFAGLIIIAANAGGAWSPIGDVTTTMLWIGGQVTSIDIMLHLFFPSLICFLVPLIIASLRLKGAVTPSGTYSSMKNGPIKSSHRNIIFFSGIGVLLLVPVFKSLTHLPPFMGMLLGLGILWIISEIIHRDRDTEEKDLFSVAYALRKIDTPSILFFLGILIAIAALQSAGILIQFSSVLDSKIGNQNLVVIIIGLCSAIVDNVPLVAASMGMYSLERFSTDHSFWKFLAYCAGTGGSAMIIGSAAGVAVMGMEKISFFWYLKKISWLALIGFFMGAFTYILFFS